MKDGGGVLVGWEFLKCSSGVEEICSNFDFKETPAVKISGMVYAACFFLLE